MRRTEVVSYILGRFLLNWSNVMHSGTRTADIRVFVADGRVRTPFDSPMNTTPNRTRSGSDWCNGYGLAGRILSIGIGITQGSTFSHMRTSC